MNSESFHRLLKTLLDSGEAKTLEQAKDTFAKYGVRVVLNASVCSSVSQQMIALTVINTASRCFLGNGNVESDQDIVLTAPGFENQLLSEFCDWAGVAAGGATLEDWPVIAIGSGLQPGSGNAICPWAAGWVFGLGNSVVTNDGLFAPACVAAGAIAISEAFSMLRLDNPYAGKRHFAFCLWSMTEGCEQGPTTVFSEILRDGLWIVGLGHLGQAYCWTLGFFPDSGATLLQDMDTVTGPTISTSVLSGLTDLGSMKTRVVAAWLEKRGFKTRLLERRFDSSTRIAFSDPSVALFGVDNASARRCCEQAGFSLVLDAGLGSGYRDFRAIRIRAFPGASNAAQIWAQDQVPNNTEVAPAYTALVADGHDPCGITTLATRAVGAPFVGCYAAAILVAQLFKRRLSGAGADVLDVNLRNPGKLETA